MLKLEFIFVLFCFCNTGHCFFYIQDIISDTMMRLPDDFTLALKDIAEGLPAKTITVVRGESTNIRSRDMIELFCLLSEHKIQVINLNIHTEANKNNNELAFAARVGDRIDQNAFLAEPNFNLIRPVYYGFLKKALDTSEERTSFILCEPHECENILEELTENNLIHRTILYIFFWPRGVISDKFLNTIREAMRVAVITNPRKSVFRVYYNQATSNRLHFLSLVNWWSGRLYKSPVLPPADKVYEDFRGRVFDVPVLHAPPWHFVKYNNDSTVNVTGGRDDKLLALLANKLNFKYKYYDPPDRSQGSSISGNGTFRGTLGLIWKRKADFFVGDVTMTWERLQAVEFSFLTLADSGAFLTHAPAKLSETLAIIRPFRWEVWPLVCATVLVTGPALWFVIAAPSLWQRRRCNQLNLLNNCCWFTTTLFLRQSSSKEPSKTHKARLVSVLVSLGATYVIGDMYSANLTSLLARPAREQPIGTLQALEEAMRDKGYELVVERHSSSLTILEEVDDLDIELKKGTDLVETLNQLMAEDPTEYKLAMKIRAENFQRIFNLNGTGVYGRLAKLMRRQRVQRVRSVELGVRLVLSRRRVAILGGRETLYYDTERFGSHNFHLSEKLYTRYSAIALQIGCPYLETFNNVVMTLFEAGILAKMTTDEYKNLPEQSRRSEPVMESDSPNSEISGDSPTTGSQTQAESTKGLEPVSLVMLRGAFCLLGIGYLLAALALVVEIQVYRRSKLRTQKLQPVGRKVSTTSALEEFRRRVGLTFRKAVRSVYDYVDRALGPAVH